MSEILVTVTSPGNSAVTVDASSQVNATVASGGSVAVSVPGLEVAYSSLIGTPATFTPSAHTHKAADISDRSTALVTSVNGKTGDITITEGGGASVTDALPEALAPTAFAGVSLLAARGDHVHPVPSAAQVGALGPNSAVDGGDYVGVYLPPNTPTITITTQPSNQTAANGIATFTVAAKVSDSSVPDYQWQKQEGGEGAWSTVIGATSTQLSLSGLTNAADDGDKYRVIVSAESAGAVVSNAATLTVPGAVQSTATPVPAFVYNWYAVNGAAAAGCDGFYRSRTQAGYVPVWPTVTATPPAGATTVTYQWQVKNTPGVSNWSNIAGAQSSTFNTSSLGINYSTYGSNPILPPIYLNTSQYTFNAPAVRCVITADGVETVSETRPILLSGFTSPAAQGTLRPNCATSDSQMIQAWSYIGNQSVSRVVFANSGYASLTLPSAAPVPVGSQSDYEVFGNGQDGSYTAVFEKSTDGGVTWATYGQVLRTAYGQYTSFQVNPPTDYLQATDAGVLYRARLGALDELDVRASIYTTPIRVDYVVIGFTMPSLANQTAIGGEATFSLTFSPHVSGVPIGGFWERSTNGGSTWSTVAGGTRTISGSNTVMSLALTGLTSANNQTLYRFAAMAHGYGNNFQTPIFGRTNSATLTVT